MFYQEIIQGLNDASIRYLVVGGVAVNLYGVPRMTYDLDLMISLDEKNVLSTIDVMKKLGLAPRLPVRAEEFAQEGVRRVWKEQKNMLVFSFARPGREFQTVDFFIENPLDFEECYARRNELQWENQTVFTISLEDLIKLKRQSGRKQDQADIESLEQLRRINE